MFGIISAISLVGGTMALVHGTNKGEKKDGENPKKDVDPATAALLAARSLSLSLPQPIASHALSTLTNPPSILVPSHTPSPPVPDLQVLATLIIAVRKHALNRWKSQSLFVEEEDGLDMGVWIGPVDGGDGKDGGEAWRKNVAGGVVERLTDGKAGKKDATALATIIPLPATAASDDGLQKALSPMNVHVAFSLPLKDGRQALFLVGRNAETGNWIAVGAARGGNEEQKAAGGTSEGQKPTQKQDVDPATAALLAAKSLSLSLPRPIASHGLSTLTDPPSILVPSHTPSPPRPDLQVLATLIIAARKHALTRWKSQSLFVKQEEGLDMGVWIGPVAGGDGKDDGEMWRKGIAGGVVEKLTDGNAGKKEVTALATIVPLPTTAAFDATLQKALSPLDVHVAFELPFKDGSQASFLVGRNAETGNWIAIGAARGGKEEQRAVGGAKEGQKPQGGQPSPAEAAPAPTVSQSSAGKVSRSPPAEVDREVKGGDGAEGQAREGERNGGRGTNRRGRGSRRRRGPGRGGGAGEAGEAPPVEKGKERPQEQSQPPQQGRQASRQPRQQPQQQPESTAVEGEPSGARGRGRGRGRGGRRRRRGGGGAGRGGGATAPADAGRAP